MDDGQVFAAIADERRELADFLDTLNVDRLRAVLAFLVTPTAKRIFRSPSGMRWKATDLEWSHGNGPEVEGPAEALMLTLSGRSAARADLSGEGTTRLPNQIKP